MPSQASGGLEEKQSELEPGREKSIFRRDEEAAKGGGATSGIIIIVFV